VAAAMTMAKIKVLIRRNWVTPGMLTIKASPGVVAAVNRVNTPHSSIENYEITITYHI
jgi:hypothetical protein